MNYTGNVFAHHSLDGSYERAMENWERIAYEVDPIELTKYHREKYKQRLSESTKATIVLLLISILVISTILLSFYLI